MGPSPADYFLHNNLDFFFKLWPCHRYQQIQNGFRVNGHPTETLIRRSFSADNPQDTQHATCDATPLQTYNQIHLQCNFFCFSSSSISLIPSTRISGKKEQTTPSSHSQSKKKKNNIKNPQCGSKTSTKSVVNRSKFTILQLTLHTAGGALALSPVQNRIWQFYTHSHIDPYTYICACV